MHLPTVKHLVENFEKTQLEAAEAAILEEQTPEIEIGGADEGEQLTHVIAAIWIKNDMIENHRDLRDSMREYTKKVRKSID
ncbi:MAG: hypothetical protein H6607_12095 [Flavobacteriales bacterium]|nr:hypothetical protein [Flavobacteriales bacterium]